MIVRSGRKWVIISHTTGKVLGRYDTKAEAEKALKRRRRKRK